MKNQENFLLNDGESAYYKLQSALFAARVYAVIVSLIVLLMCVIISFQYETIKANEASNINKQEAIDSYKSQLLQN